MERITQVWIDTIPLHVPMLPLDELATRARRHGETTGASGLSLKQLEHDYLHTTMLASPVLPNARLRASWSDRLRTRWEARMEHAITGCYPHLACPAESRRVRSAQRHSARPMTGVPALTALST
ncbi:MAG TPA: hypothetical protein VND63_01885 [Rhodanobacteraceae bacterium]|nr:hypothetical protein [Rhodanobacteraceae bacterium]